MWETGVFAVLYKGADRLCCSKRSSIYEMWCEECLHADIKKIKETVEDEKDQEEIIKGIKKYKYIGETSRSIFERSCGNTG